LHVGKVLGHDQDGEDVHWHSHSALEEHIAVVQDIREVEFGEIVTFMSIVGDQGLP